MQAHSAIDYDFAQEIEGKEAKSSLWPEYRQSAYLVV